jgi:hypothetical protein
VSHTIDMGEAGGTLKFEDGDERGRIEIRPRPDGSVRILALSNDNIAHRELEIEYLAAECLDTAFNRNRPILSCYATAAAKALGRREIFGKSAEDALWTIFWDTACAPMNAKGWFAHSFPKKAAWYRRAIEQTPGLRYGSEHRTFDPSSGERRDGGVDSLEAS